MILFGHRTVTLFPPLLCDTSSIPFFVIVLTICSTLLSFQRVITIPILLSTLRDNGPLSHIFGIYNLSELNSILFDLQVLTPLMLKFVSINASSCGSQYWLSMKTRWQPFISLEILLLSTEFTTAFYIVGSLYSIWLISIFALITGQEYDH